MLTVNGDVCFANEPAGGSSNNTDGLSGVEIVGSGNVPTARGISVDADPNGDFNFYINDYQGVGGLAAEFNFKKHDVSGNPITNLMTLNASGQLILGWQDGTGNQNTPTINSTHQAATLQVKGDVVVGTSTSGSAHANIWVTETGWADFVFDNSYKLMPLNEVEKFYKANHHLPSVPSQKDIQEKGNNLAETDVVLLQKIEELTLYMVQQEKRIKELEKKLADKK
jgi:hypothetical protein